MSAAFLLCEGYDDRQFWAAWLKVLGCTDARGDQDPGWGRLDRKHFRFRTPTGRRLALIVVDGSGRKSERVAETFLAEHGTHPIGHLLLCEDADSLAGAPLPDDTERTRRLTARAPGVQVDCVRWWAPDRADAPGVPDKQTLERLIVASLVAVWPERARSVEAWLASEPVGDPPTGKSHLYSHLAKWFHDTTPDGLASRLWASEPVRAELERRLEATGVTARVAALLA